MGRQNGIMLGFKSDQVVIEKEDETQMKNNVIIGIFNQNFGKNYSALIGMDLLEERSESNELATNIKR